MRQRQWGMYAIALAILIVGLIWAGVPASTLLIAGLVLACPLMMLVMMRGMSQDGAAPKDDESAGPDKKPGKRPRAYQDTTGRY